MRQPAKTEFWQPFTVQRKTTNPYDYIPRMSNIVYPEYSTKRPLHKVVGMGGFAITSHLAELMAENEEILGGAWSSEVDLRSYRHVFVWSTGEAVMTDVDAYLAA